MDDMNLVNEIIATVLGDRTDIQTSVIYADDLYEEALQVCGNPVYLDYLQGLPQSVRDSMHAMNSLYLPPKDLQSKHLILISNRQREDGYSHYSVIAQEAVHALNHTIFCETRCGGDVSQIPEHKLNRAFRIWDAFDARRTGHRLYLSLILENLAGYSVAEISNLLQQQELPERLQEINVLLTEKNSVDLYTRLASVLGLFHVWEAIYEIPIAPHMNTWIYNLYEALKKYGSVQVANFEALEEDIQQLWTQRLI